MMRAISCEGTSVQEPQGISSQASPGLVNCVVVPVITVVMQGKCDYQIRPVGSAQLSFHSGPGRHIHRNQFRSLQPVHLYHLYAGSGLAVSVSLVRTK